MPTLFVATVLALLFAFSLLRIFRVAVKHSEQQNTAPTEQESEPEEEKLSSQMYKKHKKMSVHFE